MVFAVLVQIKVFGLLEGLSLWLNFEKIDLPFIHEPFQSLGVGSPNRGILRNTTYCVHLLGATSLLVPI